MKNKVSISKPQKIRRFSSYEKVIIVGITMLVVGIFLVIISSLISYVPLFSMDIFSLGGILIFSSGIMLYMTIPKKRKKKKGVSALLDNDKFNSFCFENRLFTESLNDSRKINIPKVALTSDGFKLSALPGIASRLIDAKDDLNNFLAQNESNMFIISAFAGGDGWIYYIVKKDFRKDRLSRCTKLN